MIWSASHAFGYKDSSIGTLSIIRRWSIPLCLENYVWSWISRRRSHGSDLTSSLKKCMKREVFIKGSSHFLSSFKCGYWIERRSYQEFSSTCGSSGTTKVIKNSTLSWRKALQRSWDSLDSDGDEPLSSARLAVSISSRITLMNASLMKVFCRWDSIVYF